MHPFLGVYSAPIALPLYATAFERAGRLHNLEAFASHNGPDFYGLPRNSGKVTLERRPGGLFIPEKYDLGEGSVVPMWAGQKLDWVVL
jgi:dihydroorotase